MSGAYAASVVALAEVGVTVWSRTRGYAGVGEDGTQLEPIGGVVLDVVEVLDRETGEIKRALRVLDPTRTRPLRFHVLHESEVDPDTLEPPSTSRCVALIRRLAEELAFNERGKRRGGLFHPEHAELVADMGRLVSVVMGVGA